MVAIALTSTIGIWVIYRRRRSPTDIEMEPSVPIVDSATDPVEIPLNQTFTAEQFDHAEREYELV